jgi:hypothetical protein
MVWPAPATADEVQVYRAESARKQEGGTGPPRIENDGATFVRSYSLGVPFGDLEFRTLRSQLPVEGF